MANFLGTPKVQFFDDSGEPLSGGKLYSYISGTTTAKATYPTLADAEAGTNANSNPVILDSRGEATIVLTGSYKLILKTSADVQIWSVDAIGTTSNTLLNDVYGNDVLVLASGGASSVNAVTVTNALTTVAPQITATGTDTNIDLKVASKGSGTLKLDAGATGTIDIGTVSTGQINLKRNTAITGTAAVSGNATVGGTLGVTGAATLASVGVTGAATVGTTLGVTGNTTLTGTLTTGAVTLNSTLNTFSYPSTDGANSHVLTTNGSKSLSLQHPLKSNIVFRAYDATTGTSVASSTGPIKLNLGTESFDSHSYFASNGFTPLVAGYYRITGSALINNINTTTFKIYLYKGGTSVIEAGGTPSMTVGTLSVSDIIYLNGSTDTVYLYGFQVNSGAAAVLVIGQLCGELVRAD